jgi:hypothetical protein
MNTQAPTLIIDGTVLPVTVHPIHEYTLTTAQVAEGYGVDPANIRKTLQRHGDEIIEGKHFIYNSHFEQCVTNSHAGSFQRVTTNWTKRGIVRLGFFIRSERAKRFRDLAEDLVIGHIETASSPAAKFCPVVDLGEKMHALPIRSAADVALYRQIAQLRAELAGAAAVPADEKTRALIEWVRQIASMQAELGRMEREYTLPELLAQAPPIPKTVGDKKCSLGRHLKQIEGQAIVLGGGKFAAVSSVRKAHARMWLVQVSPEM